MSNECQNSNIKNDNKSRFDLEERTAKFRD